MFSNLNTKRMVEILEMVGWSVDTATDAGPNSKLTLRLKRFSDKRLVTMSWAGGRGDIIVEYPVTKRVTGGSHITTYRLLSVKTYHLGKSIVVQKFIKYIADNSNTPRAVIEKALTSAGIDCD